MDIRFNFSQAEHTPGGKFLHDFYYRHGNRFADFLLPWEKDGYPNNGGEHTLVFTVSPGRIADILFKMTQALPQHASEIAKQEQIVMSILEQKHPAYVGHYNSVMAQLIEEHADNVPPVKRWFVRGVCGEIEVHPLMVTNAYSDYLKSTTSTFNSWKSYTQAEYTKLVEGMLKYI